MRTTLLLLTFVLSVAEAARNVSFPDIDFFVKTEYFKGKTAEEETMELWWCQMGRDGIEKRECVALSSCRYLKTELLAEVKKMAKNDVQEELGIAVTDTYQTELKAVKYLPELLKLLKNASAKKECILVTEIEVKDSRHANLKFEYPELKHGR